MNTLGTSRKGLGAIGAILLLAAATGCSSSGPVAGAPDPGPGMVQFTSADGFLTINVPQDWRECASEATDVFSSLGTLNIPGTTIPAAWDLDDGVLYGGASVIIIAHPVGPLETDQEVAAEEGWTALQEVFAGAEFTRQANLVTSDGHSFERMDLKLTTSGGTMEQVSLVSIFDGMGVEIAVTLVNETRVEKADALDALRTMVFS